MFQSDDSGTTVYDKNGDWVYSTISGIQGLSTASGFDEMEAEKGIFGINTTEISSDTTLTLDQTRGIRFLVTSTSTVTGPPLSCSPISGNTVPPMRFHLVGNSGLTLFANSSTIPIYYSAGTDFKSADAVWINPGSYGTVLGMDTVVTGSTAYYVVYYISFPFDGTRKSGCTLYAVGDGS